MNEENLEASEVTISDEGIMILNLLHKWRRGLPPGKIRETLQLSDEETQTQLAGLERYRLVLFEIVTTRDLRTAPSAQHPGLWKLTSDGGNLLKSGSLEMEAA